MNYFLTNYTHYKKGFDKFTWFYDQDQNIFWLDSISRFTIFNTRLIVRQQT